MEPELLAQADRIVAALAPGRREMVREIVHDATRRGYLTPSGRRFLNTATGSELVADVLAAGIAESAAPPAELETDGPAPLL